MREAVGPGSAPASPAQLPQRLRQHPAHLPAWHPPKAEAGRGQAAWPSRSGPWGAAAGCGCPAWAELGARSAAGSAFSGPAPVPSVPRRPRPRRTRPGRPHFGAQTFLGLEEPLLQASGKGGPRQIRPSTQRGQAEAPSPRGTARSAGGGPRGERGPPPWPLHPRASHPHGGGGRTECSSPGG